MQQSHCVGRMELQSAVSSKGNYGLLQMVGIPPTFIRRLYVLKAAGQAMRVVRNDVQARSTSSLEEAVQFGSHATDNCCSDVASNSASFSDLVDYCKQIFP